MNITRTIKINTPYCPVIAVSVTTGVPVAAVVASTVVVAAVVVGAGVAAVVVGAGVAAVVGAVVGAAVAAAVVEDIYNIYTQIIHPSNWYCCSIAFHFLIYSQLARNLQDIQVHICMNTLAQEYYTPTQFRLLFLNVLCMQLLH